MGIRYPCDQCTYISSEARTLVSHKKKKHSNADDASKTSDGSSEFQCNECEFNGTSARSLTRHKKVVHLGIKRFKCDQCKYGAYEKNKLKLHKERFIKT